MLQKLLQLLQSLFKRRTQVALQPPVQPSPSGPATTPGMHQPGDMRINAAGLALIKEFEGLQLESYADAVGVWTIGYGHTGPGIQAGQHITQEQAEAMLQQDIRRFEVGVNKLVTVPLSDNQFAALVSFSFNLGLRRLEGSTLLRLLNQQDYQGAACEFERWNKAAGKVMPGLTRRRQAEFALFRR